MPFNFALLSTLWSARSIEKIIAEYEAALPRAPGRTGCSAITTGRGSRAGSAPDQARVAAMLLLTLRGTPTLYYGDEIGMRQVAIAPDQVRDPFEKNVPGIGVGRDGCRTPMQWDATARCGLFDGARRGCRWRDDSCQRKCRQCSKPTRGSILNLYKALIALRKKRPQLVKGAYEPVAADGDILLYRREATRARWSVALNLGAEPVSIASSSIGVGRAILLSTFLDRRGRGRAGRRSICAAMKASSSARPCSVPG